MYNKVILMGRICTDLELRTVQVNQGNVSVVSFRIAVDRAYQARGEERKSDFFNVVAWRANAEFICRYFGKGRMIMLDGELQTRQYVDKNGITQYVVEIIADRVTFTGEKGVGSSGYSNGAYAPPPPPPPTNTGYSAGKYQNNNYSNNSPAQATEQVSAMTSGGANDFADAEEDDDYPF